MIKTSFVALLVFLAICNPSSGKKHGEKQEADAEAMADKNAKMEILFKLTAAGCHCNNKNYITVASEDNKILNRHTDQLGKYFFEGKMYSERPVYVNKGT